MSATPLNIYCHNFSEDDMISLRSLLKLIAQYVPRLCVVVPDLAQANLIMVNLDADSSVQFAPPPGLTVIGCSIMPKMHAHGTIYRPIRPSQLLSALTDAAKTTSAVSSATAEPASSTSSFSGRSRQEPQQKAASGEMHWHYKIISWPLDFEQQPRDWWKIYAYLSQNVGTAEQIATATELSLSEVERCLETLEGSPDLHRTAEWKAAEPATHAAQQEVPSGWRALTSRVGKLFGFRK